jgi:cytochrome c biogenesis protein ResB
MSHRRIWLVLGNEGKTTTVLMTGSTNKNKNGFEKTFAILTEQLAAQTGKEDKQ